MSLVSLLTKSMGYKKQTNDETYSIAYIIQTIWIDGMWAIEWTLNGFFSNEIANQLKKSVSFR